MIMVDDILTHDERLRLECLAQANATSSPRQDPETIIDKAIRFETYIRTGAKDNG